MVLVKKVRWHGSVVWLAALLMFGCLPEAQAEAKKPHQDEAMQIVWVQTYGMDISTAPPVTWVEGNALDCPWDPGVSFKLGDTCAFGASDETQGWLKVAWSGQWRGVTDETYPHELCHWRQWLLTGDGDINHQGICFKGQNLATDGQVALMKAELTWQDTGTSSTP